MYCTQCGSGVADDARYCGACGKPLSGSVSDPVKPAPTEQRTEPAAALPPAELRCPQCSRFSPPGSYTCDCGDDFRTATNPKAIQLTFFPVATHKFIVLSLCSFSIYEIYWFYQQWKRIRDSSGETWMSPFFRGLFAVLWVVPLLQRIRKRAEAGGISVRWSAGALGAVFIILTPLWRLPDPWWLVAWGSLVALVPAVQTCQEVNASTKDPEGLNNQYSTANVATIIIGLSRSEMMTARFRELDTVVLIQDLPDAGLRSGDLGAIVMVYGNEALEVEFVTASGRTQALLTLPIDAVRPVRDADLLAVRTSPPVRGAA